MSMTLSVESLSGGYGPLTVLKDISFTANPGEILVVLGRNGAGKTSLMAAIAGILPTVSSGMIRVGDTVITSMPAHKRVKSGIGLVQEGKRVFRSRTVEENLLLGTVTLDGVRMNAPHRHKAVKAAYERFPILEEKRHERAGGLSGGQQQMLAISQVLAAEPSIILLDEPSAGLAPAIQKEVFGVAETLRDDGLTVVIVEQLVDVALDIADYVVVLDSGSIVSHGTPAEYANSDVLKNIYLGTS